VYPSHASIARPLRYAPEPVRGERPSMEAQPSGVRLSIRVELADDSEVRDEPISTIAERP